MKLYLDNVIFSLQQAGGISVVWFELIKRAMYDPDFEILFLDVPNQNIFRKQLNIPHGLIIDNPLRSYTIALRRYLNPNKLKGKGIFHSSYYRTTKNPEMINVTTVHDFTYEYYRKGLAKGIHSWQKGSAIKNAHKIICVSENTKKDLLKFHPKTPPKKIKVIYNGVDEAYRVLSNYKMSLLAELVPFNPKEYAVFVGDRNSNHKNFKVAAEACKATNTPLVLIGGGKITKNENAFFKQIDFLKYRHLSGIKNEQLNVIYNYALCLVYPSSYEGFGIPLIEAQKAGCPVISSNNSSISEIARDSALLIEEITTENFANKIDLLKNNSAIVEQLVKDGLQNSGRFSWEKCYQQTKGLYQELYDEYFD